MKNVALVGVGFMGRGIAKNLIAKALPGSQIHLFDSNLRALDRYICDEVSKQYDCSNVHTSSSTKDVLRVADVIALSLPSERIIEHVLFDRADGMITNYVADSSRREDKVIVDHSTCSKQFVINCHERAKGTLYACYVNGLVC